MIYTMRLLDECLDAILPSIASAKKQGVEFNRITLLNMVAVEIVSFMSTEGEAFLPNPLIYPVIDALREVKETGELHFGTVDTLGD